MLITSCSKDGSPSARRTHTTSTVPGETAPTTTVKLEEGPAHGNVSVTVPTGSPTPTLAPVAMTATASFGNKVEARLTKLEAVNATASMPGEFTGPAVAVTAEITNGSSTPIDLNAVTVDMQSADGVPFTQVTPTPPTAFSGTLDPGRSATGRYIFTVKNTAARDNVRLSIEYAAQVPTVLFTGNVPHA
jgi:hypothetical protein